MLQPIAAGFIAAISGFATSFALVIAGLQAVGATQEQSSSGLLTLCLASGILTVVLSAAYRQPISIVWSTPGAAVLVAAASGGTSFSTAVGAFIVSGVLIFVCGLWPALGRAISRIPKPVASAMLAGILLPICLAPVAAVAEFPLLAGPIVLVWLILLRVAPRWAVPAAMLVATIVIVASAGTDWLPRASLAPALVFVAPEFDPFVMVSLGLPLFIVTMAGQNVPGFVVMSSFGYPAPSRAIFLSTGVASTVGAFFGGHAVNLAAITAAIAASPEAHPDRSRRWIAAVVAGSVFVAIGLAAGVATALVSESPPILIIAVAGLAVLGALVSSITSALEEPDHRMAAIATFLVTASGITALGIGSAFWGLVAGALFMLWLRPRPVGRGLVETAPPQ
ncbi:benzoate/H(+) symporter BenE family transporter [Salinibacterium hongtaonis]|uniref:Benzoate transporter n=1 Tax=Homoserinimonas hongtaonis TaxID=2079791 RepID=A0A2U1SZ64_9MICO|nr:benzoate/H(+) symporter BenE family transporter [Salinibacterium hongtaonis]PWB96920.1 benzoate transporter [Salinibacterium hongtaonis]